MAIMPCIKMVWSLGEMSGAMAGQGILAGSSGLNFWTMLGALKGAAYGVQFACSMRGLIVAAVTGDAGEFLLALSNGIVSFVGLIGICETHFAVQILTKALAAYGVKENGEKFLNAVKKGDAAEILVSGLNLTMDIVTLFSSCFDGDTPVATETGFRRIDEIRAGDRVWSYNVETGERALKEVKEVFVRENDELLHIETSRGAVDATTSHPFYVVGKGWVAAGDLAVGDGIQAISGDAGIVTGLRLEKLDKPIPVYNLDVEDFHSYFVEGILVHNRCSWLDKLKKNGQTVPDGMTKPHGHHILYQTGIGDTQQELVRSGQRILRAVGIDPIKGMENLVIAPNTIGQHTTKNLRVLVDALKNASGDYDKVVAVLIEYGKKAAGR